METGTNRERLWAVFSYLALSFDGFKRCRGYQPGLLTNPSKVIVSDIVSGKFQPMLEQSSRIVCFLVEAVSAR